MNKAVKQTPDVVPVSVLLCVNRPDASYAFREVELASDWHWGSPGSRRAGGHLALSAASAGSASQRLSASNGSAVPLYVMKCRRSVFNERVHHRPETR